jgi:predicted HAD superfamily Cof-like phosphohydrolase
MTDMITDQKSFMYLGNQSTTTYNPEQMKLYGKLIQEEFSELMDAIHLTSDDSEIIKEACDVLVVTLGFLLSMGIDVHKAWELVHRNNLSKVSNQDTVVKDVQGKIQKSPESIKRKAEMMKGLKELLNDSVHK